MTAVIRRPAWLLDAERVDVALYAAVAATPTPALDRAMRRLAVASDRSRLSIAAAAGLALARGASGRRAAVVGLTSVALTSAVVNLGVKPLARRRRPQRDAAGVALARQVPMPRTRSLPSGHSASAFAFATAVGAVLPHDAVLLRALAALVGYSRVHTGVHFPGDVVVGALIGAGLGQITARVLARGASG